LATSIQLDLLYLYDSRVLALALSVWDE